MVYEGTSKVHFLCLGIEFFLPVGGYVKTFYVFGIGRHAHSNVNERLFMQLTLEGLSHVHQIGEIIQVFSVAEVVLPEGVKVCLGVVDKKWKIMLISKFKND